MKRKKRDSLKITVFPEKNNDFQGSLPRWKHCNCLSNRVFLFNEKRCKNKEKIEFFNEKNNPKRRWLQIRQKTPPDTLPETTFWTTSPFFIVFCCPAVSGWTPKMTSRTCAARVRDALKSSVMFAASPNRPDGPPDGSRQLLGHVQGCLRNDFGDDFLIDVLLHSRWNFRKTY